MPRFALLKERMITVTERNNTPSVGEVIIFKPGEIIFTMDPLLKAEEGISIRVVAQLSIGLIPRYGQMSRFSYEVISE